uniref:Putative neurotoxin LTDF S-17 n=1 Tax=Dolomedes fimbriatus TaxID=1432569 RepID=A0A0K1D8H5_9ARAC|nr:putative neurotoxin LTDF S-17 [Dolomedes fimbriatus]
MWLKLHLILFGVTLIAVLVVHAELDSSENTELARKDSTCIKPPQVCSPSGVGCCYGSRCICDAPTTRCTCFENYKESLIGK